MEQSSIPVGFPIVAGKSWGRNLDVDSEPPGIAVGVRMMKLLPLTLAWVVSSFLVQGCLSSALAADSQSDGIRDLIQHQREALENLSASRTNAASASTNSVAGAAKWLTSMDQLDDSVRLGPADAVSYRVVEDHDDAVQVVISDTGEMIVPYIGRVAAAGHTCRELAQIIKKLLEEKYYYQATVIIAVDVLYRSRGKVYLVGSVRNTGAYDIPAKEEMTVTRAILLAGGFSEFANQQKVRVFRRKPASDGAGYDQLTVNVEDILEKGHLEKDVVVLPDDLIFVPARFVNF